MLFIKKIFTIPGPKELGYSDSNALPSRDFDPDCKSFCWEDYDKLIAEKFPIKNFFLNTVIDFLKYKLWYPIWAPIKTLHYWIVSHTYRRYHILDLRQPYNKGELANIDCYRYGYSDPREKMLYAMFNLLKEYLDEEPYDLSTDYSREEINADPILKTQQEYYDEAKLLLKWWQVDRKKDQLIINNLLTEWSNLRKNKEFRDNGKVAEVWERLNKAEEDFENKTDEMCNRLLKIRRGLWT